MAFSWDDVSVFLALHREQTTSRAAAALRCSQPTVVRRIAALEAAIGLTLFERTSSGFVPTKSAKALLPAALRVESAVMELDDEISSQSGQQSDLICLTLLDHFEGLFVPILREFRQQWPDTRVELLASDRIYDLARGEADIALRGRALPHDEAIVTRRLPDCAWTLYVPADIPEVDRPPDWDAAGTYVIALPDGAPAELPVYRKLASVAARGMGAIRCSRYNTMWSMIATGAAISALPVTVGDADPKLARCFPPPPEFDVEIYLLGRRAALRRPQVRDLFERIDEHFARNPSLLTGR